MDKIFASRLKALRTAERMTQKDLAVKLGVGRTTVVEYEKGNIYPTHARLLAIAALFGVSVDYLSGTGTEKGNGLSARDTKDISKRLSDLMDVLDAKTDLLFDGEIMDEQTRNLLKNSLENSYQIGKIIAKQKYTPKGKLQDEGLNKKANKETHNE